jgi:N6-adenosine-specific RNA methylase IME4
MKRDQVLKHTHPALHMPFAAQTDPLMSLTTHLPIPFDVILIDPPPSYDWSKITSIPVRLISADPSFVFLWVGDAAGDGLERGREALLRWGFRRCEEILWVKPNKKAIEARPHEEEKRPRESDVDYWLRVGRKDQGDRPKNIMVTQKEHCLMGIRGTVRRKTDNWFVHCNVGKQTLHCRSATRS